MADRTYVLSDPDGGCWYYVPSTANTYNPLRVTDRNGNDLEQGQRRGWWRDLRAPAPPVLREVLVWREKSGDVIRYRLADGWRDRPEIDLPQTLTPEVWRERALVGEDREDLDPAMLPALYRDAYVAERDDPSHDVETVDLTDATVLEGTPPVPVPEGATWRADLPVELRERPEYRHLFPGRLTGFRDAVIDALRELPSVAAYDQETFTVYAGSPRSELVADGYVSVPPRSVGGDTLADAADRWVRLLDEYVDQVRRYDVRGDCWRCEGTGTLPGGGEETRDRLVKALAAKLKAAAGSSRAAKDRARQFAEVAVDLLGPEGTSRHDR